MTSQSHRSSLGHYVSCFISQTQTNKHTLTRPCTLRSVVVTSDMGRGQRHRVMSSPHEVWLLRRWLPCHPSPVLTEVCQWFPLGGLCSLRVSGHRISRRVLLSVPLEAASQTPAAQNVAQSSLMTCCVIGLSKKKKVMTDLWEIYLESLKWLIESGIHPAQGATTRI